MTTYTCDNFRPIKQGAPDRDGYPIENIGDAAKMFARRIARAEFGRRGRVHHVRRDGWSSDGRYARYEAFVGVPVKTGGMSGRNVRFTVYARSA